MVSKLTHEIDDASSAGGAKTRLNMGGGSEFIKKCHIVYGLSLIDIDQITC